MEFRCHNYDLYRGAGVSIYERIGRIARTCREIEHVNVLLTLHMSPDFILVNISVDFAEHITSSDVEFAIAKLDPAIKQFHPTVKRVFVGASARYVNYIPECYKKLCDF